MVQFDDLSDDCLIEVFNWVPPEELFKIQRLNKRMKRLAAVKMETNIKAITWILEDEDCNTCEDHLGSRNRNQWLFLGKKIKSLRRLTKRTLFLNILTKCTGIKSLEFLDFNLPSDFFLEVVRRCSELECLILVDSVVKEKDWCKVLDQIGHQLVHFEVRHYDFKPMRAQVHNKLLSLVAEKCPNIKRVHWLVMTSLTEDLVAALRNLPKTCWVFLNCETVTEDVFEDVVDELAVCQILDWYALDNRNTRLSKLTFYELSLDDEDYEGPIRGVDFPNLKSLKFDGHFHRPESLNSLVLSRFPRLEKFGFHANGGHDEPDYDKIFQRMTSIKKLTIKYKVHCQDLGFFPSTSIRRLVNLETIIIKVSYISNISWYPENFVNDIEPYVGWISSLKKLIIKVEKKGRLRNKKKLIEAVKKMQQTEAKKRQKEKRVEIQLIFAK